MKLVQHDTLDTMQSEADKNGCDDRHPSEKNSLLVKRDGPGTIFRAAMAPATRPAIRVPRLDAIDTVWKELWSDHCHERKGQLQKGARRNSSSIKAV